MCICFETACIISSKGRYIETASLERVFMGIIAVVGKCEILPSLFQWACISDRVFFIYILTGAFHYVTCYYISRPGSCYLLLNYACQAKAGDRLSISGTEAADLLNPFFSSKS